MFFVIESLVSPKAMARIRSSIAGAEYVDGRGTASVPKLVKENREMEVSDRYLSIAQVLNEEIDSSAELAMRILPRARTNPIINCYDVGMYYREHLDEPVQGKRTQVGAAGGRFGQGFIRSDYSMTVFLSEPGEYEGGELQLTYADDPKLIKLSAGSAVCYTTGLRHSVRLVTAGTRMAAVYWFQSLIRDPGLRKELWEQYCIEEDLRRGDQHELAYRAAAVRNNILRCLAEV